MRHGVALGAQRATSAEKFAFRSGDGMPNTFDWDNAEEIGIQLAEKHPGVDPLTMRFTDMHKWIVELPGFTGDPKLSNEGKLEAIQMAWHEEFQDSQ
jgi:FeS assembly protein IscX